MSQHDPTNCLPDCPENAAARPPLAEEPTLEVKPVAPKIETAASQRLDKLVLVREERAAARAEAERLEQLKAEEAKTPPPAPPAAAPKSDYEPSDTVKGAQRTLESIEKRKRIRALMIAERLRRGVEIEGELRQAAKDRDARLEAVEAKARQELAAISEAFQDLSGQRAIELNVRENEIAKLESSLVQLRKQLDAELGKLDPDLARPRKGA